MRLEHLSPLDGGADHPAVADTGGHDGSNDGSMSECHE
jgi:hypothetical protein